MKDFFWSLFVCYADFMYTCPVCDYAKLNTLPYEKIDLFSQEELESMSPPYEEIL